MDDPAQLIGATFASCTVERLLGRGGMGAVYLGRTPAGEPRALKFLAAEVAADAALRERFKREGQALEKVPPHPNVVRVHGVFEDDLLDQPYIVMEYLEGRSLWEVIRERARIPHAEAVRWILGAAQGLDALHRCGLIHRDVKPANLQLVGNGQVKVVDLGLAKDMFLSGLTEPGRVVGTIQYMAPEQWEGAPPTEASDVFGLGATLYHLLTGHGPFEGDAASVRRKCLEGDLTPVRDHAGDVPAQVEEVVLRMLRPALRDRYTSMRDVGLDLERASRGEAPALVPHLASQDARWPLTGGRRFTIGAAADQAICFAHPSVSPRHARISRKAAGFVLRDLRSARGTAVEGEPVGGTPRLLSDGDRVRFGDVEVVFHDPTARGEAAYLADVTRAVCSPHLLGALLERNDRRSLLWLLEQLSPDPLADANGRATLQRLLGDGAGEAEAEVARAEAQRRAELVPQLRALSGQALPDDVAAWLGWWCRVRLDQPVQLSPPAPERSFVVRIVAGAPFHETACGDVTLLGRDPKCRLLVQRPDVPRLLAMVVRLHRRMVLRMEDQVAFFNPGAPLEVSGVRVELIATEQQGAQRLAIDAPRFGALVRRAHPATAAALVDCLEDAQRDWRAPSAALFPADPTAAAWLSARARDAAQERADVALGVLPGLVGRSCGADVGAWRQLLAGRDLGPQVLPVG